MCIRDRYGTACLHICKVFFVGSQAEHRCAFINHFAESFSRIDVLSHVHSYIAVSYTHLYRKRALNYRNIYDTSIGFARPRYSDGTFKKEFDVLQTYGEGFIEGNSWNFSLHVPHDVFGMIDLMGGEKTFVQKLDELFSMHLPEKYYEHNEDITDE